MTDVQGKYLIIKKHMSHQKKSSRKKRRMFHEENELDTMRRLAAQYAEGNDQDFSRPSDKEKA